MKLKSRLSLALTLWLVAACSPNVETRGHILDTDWQNSVKEGMTREKVLAQLGSPSTVSSFGEETWYYITLQRQSKAFFKPKVTEQEVVRVIFSESGTVTGTDVFTEADMRDFAIAKRETPTEGHQLTIVEQTIGNLGRFNSSSAGRNPSSVRRGAGGY